SPTTSRAGTATPRRRISRRSRGGTLPTCRSPRRASSVRPFRARSSPRRRGGPVHPGRGGAGPRPPRGGRRSFARACRQLYDRPVTGATPPAECPPSDDILDLLACPDCGGALDAEPLGRAADTLRCACGARFPIAGGIPRLLTRDLRERLGPLG